MTFLWTSTHNIMKLICIFNPQVDYHFWLKFLKACTLIDLIDTLSDVRYWSEVLCCTITTLYTPAFWQRAQTTKPVEIHTCIVRYPKFPKYLDTQNICCNHSKIWTLWLYHRVMSPNDADGMANSVDPDQTAPLGAVWSGSALFAQAYLSENLGTLRY